MADLIENNGKIIDNNWKCNDAEKEKRIETIYYKLLKNYTRQEIIQFVTKETDWGIKERQIDIYISLANDKIREGAKVTYADWLAKSKQQLEYLYKIACEEGDVGEARQIKLTENKILGYEKLTIDSNVKVASVLDEDLDKLIDEKLLLIQKAKKENS